ncbi:alpha/beta hydrolase [Geomonas sp. Red69]|uniref:Alpha/beta hydrolase n=1 Tax=Geomonas diazotrophica TaxID=2843197 RepID=A0ABX8JE43_9BACT|nr:MULTISPECIES: alpha/beta hydrolase [Geomonas]MBU5637846.1 alpha/beta hydrolase [Geomonas diazotrophica]QWV96573.1 alpha/beta hydrolase [Geomonas nitrogeniifigens]
MDLANLPLNQCHLSEREILAYRCYGSGPLPVVLVHGLAARSETWTDQVPLFPADRYTLYLLDLLGSGASSKPSQADYSIRGHSLRLLGFLDQLGLERVTLVGHSLGGAVVLLTAVEAMLRHADRLLAAMVIMAGPGYIQRLPLMAEIFENRLAAALFVALYAPDLWIKVGLKMAYHDHKLVDREHIARYAPCYRSREAKRALVETCRSLVPLDQEQIAARYRDLSLPVLLLWGSHDRIVPLSQGTRLEAAIAGAELRVIQECGHNPQEEKPAETFGIIDSFITRSIVQD